MNIGKYKLISDWEIANTAHTALAEYDGKKHFLKKYNNYKMPRKNASTSAELYARQEEEFKAFVDYRTALNTKLGKIAQSGGNIILPSEWFVADNVFVEATEFIEGTVSEGTLFKLSDDDKYFLLLTAAGALKSLHSASIIHSDLKRSNILVIKNAYGKYIAKIIDFDKSYFEGRPRVNDLGGDQCYVSPELAYCLMSDLAESGVKALSTKSDIFSLGLVFYNYLCRGGFPALTNEDGESEGSAKYCGEASLRNGTLTVGAEIKEEYLRALIANMLYRDPEKRPSAQKVVDVLKSKTVLPVLKGMGVRTIATRAAKADEAAESVVAAHEYRAASGAGELIVEYEKLRKAGFVKVECEASGASMKYKLYKSDGSYIYMNPQVLVLTGYAKRR